MIAKEVQYGSNESVRSINGSDGNGGGNIRRAKLFFNDFDNDGQLEFISWRKYYDVKYVDSKEGLNQSKQDFQRFVLKENNTFQLTDVKLQNKDDIVSSYVLEWEKGFPENLLCK